LTVVWERAGVGAKERKKKEKISNENIFWIMSYYKSMRGKEKPSDSYRRVFDF